MIFSHKKVIFPRDLMRKYRRYGNISTKNNQVIKKLNKA
jgi:hypothetical protein